jgi:hypothetical protein
MQDKIGKEQRYVPIGEAAKMLGVSKDTLRRWEKKGKIITRRSPTNHRYYAISHLHDLMEAKFPPPPNPANLKPMPKPDITKPEAASAPPADESTHKPILNPLPDTPKEKPSSDETAGAADIPAISLTPLQADAPKPAVEKKEPSSSSSLNENKEWMPVDMPIKNINLSANDKSPSETTSFTEKTQEPEQKSEDIPLAKLEPVKKPQPAPITTPNLNEMVTSVKVAQDKKGSKFKLKKPAQIKTYLLVAVIIVVVIIIITSLGLLIVPRLNNRSNHQTGQTELLSPLSD